MILKSTLLFSDRRLIHNKCCNYPFILLSYAPILLILQLQFFIPLNSSIDFSKCRKVFIRGYNKAGIWSTMSKEIKTCSVKDGNSFIVPKLVIDAIGEQETNLGIIVVIEQILFVNKQKKKESIPVQKMFFFFFPYSKGNR